MGISTFKKKVKIYQGVAAPFKVPFHIFNVQNYK